MRVIDPGHKYELDCLDGDANVQTLTFVKRNNPPEKYPGNEDAYPGVTSQEVIRALIDRAKYVNNQIPHPANDEVIYYLRRCLIVLEERARERRGIKDNLNYLVHRYYNGPRPEEVEACKICGHWFCKEHN